MLTTLAMLHELEIPAEAAGERLDVWLESQLVGCTRSLVTRCIKQGACVVSRQGTELKKIKAGLALKGHEVVAIEVPDLSPITVEPESMDLDIVHEDGLVLIINKPPGMVVHPAVGHRHGTLLSGALAYLGCSTDTPVANRPALIHRLDADTTGLIAVAKNEAALNHFQAAFAAREVKKRYLALVHGVPQSDYLVADQALGRHPKDFRKRAVLDLDGPHGKQAKEAYTSFVMRERHDGYSVIEARPRTGRTHQIRVHLAHLRHPILADRVYGRADHWPVGNPQEAQLHRQALHAWQLSLPYPGETSLTTFYAPVPADIQALMSDSEMRPLASQ